MRSLELGSTLALCMLLSLAACHRIAADDEVPEWLFDAYSNLPVTTAGDKAVSRYRFFDDHRVELERDLGCGGQTTVWELHWTSIRSGFSVTRAIAIQSSWLGVRKADGMRSDAGQLYRGAVCSAPVPPPDDWGGGEWDECEWFWCDVPPVDSCGP